MIFLLFLVPFFLTKLLLFLFEKQLSKLATITVSNYDSFIVTRNINGVFMGNSLGIQPRGTRTVGCVLEKPYIDLCTFFPSVVQLLGRHNRLVILHGTSDDHH